MKVVSRSVTVVSVVGAVMLGGAVVLHAQQAPGVESHCYPMEGHDVGRYEIGTMHVPRELVYTVGGGISVRLEKRTAEDNVFDPPLEYTGVVAMTIEGEVNPDFDRLYALLLKGFDSERLSQLCFAGEVSRGASLRITAVGLRHVPAPRPPDMQKVLVCDPTFPNRCAQISGGGLEVTGRLLP